MKSDCFFSEWMNINPHQLYQPSSTLINFINSYQPSSTLINPLRKYSHRNIIARDLLQRAHKRGRTHVLDIGVLLERFADLLVSSDHGIFQAGVHQIDFSTTTGEEIALAGIDRFTGQFLHFAHDTGELVVVEAIFEATEAVV